MPQLRTLYRDQQFLSSRLGPTQIAHFYFSRSSTPEPNVFSSRLITIPTKSDWSTGFHWHEEYTEKIRIIKGRAKVTIGTLTAIFGVDDGVLTFPKFTIHGFGRADGGKTNQDTDDEELVVEEWTDPEDGFKMVFFYNIFGTLLDSPSPGRPGISDIIQLGTTIAYVDEYPVFPMPGSFMLKYIAIHVVLSTVSWTGWILGYKPWLQEYTPKDLWEVARTRGGLKCKTGLGL